MEALNRQSWRQRSRHTLSHLRVVDFWVGFSRLWVYVGSAALSQAVGVL